MSDDIRSRIYWDAEKQCSVYIPEPVPMLPWWVPAYAIGAICILLVEFAVL